MELIFSTSYDDSVFKNKHEINKKYLGPLGLLNILERELGLYSLNFSDERRIILYRKCIDKVKTDDTFYCKAFINDPLNVAKTLLKYRDELVFSGWNFLEINQPNRLNDLAKIETVFIKQEGFKGISDRWQIVLQELNEDKIKEFNIREIVLHDNIELLHPTFQKIFRKLYSIVTNNKQELIKNIPVHNLPKIKKILYKSINNKEGKIDNISVEKVANDNSLILLNFNNEQELCDLMAHYVSKDNYLVVNEDNSNFDFSLVSLNKAAAGSSQIDANTPIIQLFKLIIPCFSNELNIETLLSLLQLPYSPIPQKLSFKLIKALKEKPGVGNEKWNKIINDFTKKDNKKTVISPEFIMGLFNIDPNSLDNEVTEESQQLEEELEALQQKDDSKLIVELFLTFNNRDEIKSIKKAINIFKFIIKWAKAKIKKGSLPEILEQYTYLIELCENALIEIKDETDIKNVEKTIHSLYNAKKFKIFNKQEHSIEVIPSIENMSAQCSKSVVWLDFYNKEFEKSNQKFLLEEEIKFLKQSDSYYPENNLVDLQLHQWLRGLLNCNHKLILCFTTNGSEIKKHPLHIRMESLIDNFKENIQINVHNYEDLNVLDNWIFSVDNDGVDATSVDIPTSFAYFESDELQKIKPREKESASSIEKFIQYPFDWVMQYIAQFYETEKLKLPEGNLLKGNIAHKVIENLFMEFQNKESKPVIFTDERFDAEFDKIVEQEGAVFLQSENRFDLREFRFRFKRALNTLIEIINQNKFTIIGCEQKFGKEKDCIIEEALGRVEGSIDLLLADTAGNPFIIDLKWTSQKKYQDYLEKGNAIQLALYTAAIQNRALSNTGYFLLNQNILITAANIKGSNIQQIPVAYCNQDVLDKLQKSIEQRWSELQAGKLEMGETQLLSDLDYYKNGLFDDKKNTGLFVSLPDNGKMKKENPYTGFDLFKGTLN